jgi:hypothetical protein
MTEREILASSIRLCCDNFLTLAGIAAPGVIAINLIFQYAWVVRYAHMAGTQLVEAVLLYISLAVFQSVIATAAGVAAISEHFLGRSITVGQAYTRLVGSLFPLTGALILSTIVVAVGLLVFIVGVIAHAWFCLIGPVVMLEGEGGAGALKRSRAIVKGHFNKALLVVVCLTIAQAAAAAILLSLPNLIGKLPGLPSFFSALSIGLTLLIESLKIASTTLLYYDLRIRKEGYSLQLLEEELAFSP